MLLDSHQYNYYYVYRPRDGTISAQFAQLPHFDKFRWATAARSCKHRLFGFCLFVIAIPGSRLLSLPIIDSLESDIWLFQGLVFSAHGGPMWPKRTNQEPAYFWMILEANHMHCITIKCNTVCEWMNELQKSAAWLLFVWTMLCSVIIVRSVKSNGVSGWRRVSALKAGRPVCFEGRQARPTELIDLHSLLQTCTDLQYKLADLLSILGHVIRFQWTVLLTLI